MLQGTAMNAAQLGAREPISRLNFDPGIAAAMRPPSAHAGDAALTSRRKLHPFPARFLPGFGRGPANVPG
jgi:hypothetical protein